MSCLSCSNGNADAGAALASIAIILLLGILALTMHMALTHQPVGGKVRWLYNLINTCLALAALVFAFAAAAALSGDCFDCLKGRNENDWNIAVGATVSILGPFVALAALVTSLLRFLQDRRARKGPKDVETMGAANTPNNTLHAPAQAPTIDPSTHAYTTPPPPPRQLPTVH